MTIGRTPKPQSIRKPPPPPAPPKKSATAIKVEVDASAALEQLARFRDSLPTDRARAIAAIKAIQGGNGPDRLDRVPESMRGNVAKTLWQDATFRFGAEYGAMAALMDLFDLDESDIHEE